MLRQCSTRAGARTPARGEGKDVGKGEGKAFRNGGGKVFGKGGGKSGPYNGNVKPGTVVRPGLAHPGHLNFSLVSTQGTKGTSIPCHCNVLHADPRLTVNARGPDKL